MAARVRVRKNFTLKRISFTDRAMMAEVGKLVLRLVRTRTQAGTDANGAPFKALSPGYAAQKAKAVGSRAANLTLSGRMLNEMRATRVTSNTVSVGFTGGISTGGGAGTMIQRSRAVSGAAKAFYHNEAGAGKKKVIREFLGLTDKEQRTVERAVERAVDKRLRRGTR